MKIAFIISTSIALGEKLTNHKKFEVATNFGSVEIVSGEIDGKLIYILYRSGQGKPNPPHLVNHRANISALKILGVERVIATSVVGAINRNYNPGDLVLLNQFLDFSKKHHNTIYGKEFRFIDVTEPYCYSLREIAINSGEKLGIKIHDIGCYISVDGPRYETRAEIKMFEMIGADVVGMGNIQEAVFSRELGLCYASIALVSNMAAGIDFKHITIEDIGYVVNLSANKITALLEDIFLSGRLAELHDCECCTPTKSFFISE